MRRGCSSHSRGRQGLCSSSFILGLALCLPLAFGGSDGVSFPSLGVQGPCMFLPRLGEGLHQGNCPPPPAWPWEQTQVEQPLAQTSVKSLAQPHSSWPQTGQVIKCFYYMLLGLCGCLLHTIIMIVANGCSYQWSIFPAPMGPLVLIQRCTMYFSPWIPHSYLDLCSSQHQQF